MGNNLNDFKKQVPSYGQRDRKRFVITDTDIMSLYATGQQPSLTRYSSGFAERCIDFETAGFHSIMKLRKTGPKYIRNIDFGHPFAKESVSLSMPSKLACRVGSGNTWNNYRGIYSPSVPYTQSMLDLGAGRVPAPDLTIGTDQLALWSLGSTAIAKCLPDVPQFSLFRFVGELRAGLPKVPLKVLAKERKLRNAGGEYLNYQFGIMPLISDLQNLFEALQDPKLRAAVKSQLYEEHRVRKTIDKGSTLTSRDLLLWEMGTLSGPYSSGVTGRLETQQSYKIWTSCSFAYYQVSQLDRLLDEFDRNMGDLGLVPRAIDIWNLTPWSWLVDWFTNFNHVITNLSYLGRDGLYLQRGYIMATYETKETTTQSRIYMNRPVSTTGVRTSVKKYRVRASPFGFGLTWKDFDPFQVSILGALGVSRLRF